MGSATFNDDDIFGDPVMVHEDPPNANQVNHYPGTNGIERLDLGVAASYTIVTGELTGETPDDLGAAAETIRNLKKNGTLGTLVDTDGTEWNDAIIESFRTVGRSVEVAGIGWARKYECRIIHTGIPPSGSGEPTAPDSGSGSGDDSGSGSGSGTGS